MPTAHDFSYTQKGLCYRPSQPQEKAKQVFHDGRKKKEKRRNDGLRGQSGNEEAP